CSPMYFIPRLAIPLTPADEGLDKVRPLPRATRRLSFHGSTPRRHIRALLCVLTFSASACPASPASNRFLFPCRFPIPWLSSLPRSASNALRQPFNTPKRIRVHFCFKPIEKFWSTGNPNASGGNRSPPLIDCFAHASPAAGPTFFFGPRLAPTDRARD